MKKFDRYCLFWVIICIIGFGGFIYNGALLAAQQPESEGKDVSALFCVGTYIYEGQIVRWIDGDSVELSVDLGFNITFVDKFRLLDVDTPERGQERFDESVELVNEYAPVGSKIYIWSHKHPKKGKYGRWLAVIYNEEAKVQGSQGKSINEILVEKGWLYGWK